MSSSADSGIEEEQVIDIKPRKKREIKIIPEMEAHLETSETHWLKYGTETEDIESTISQVNSRKKLVVLDVLYTDLEKSFDRVPHRRLLRKLKKYNIHPDLIDWIKSFLSDVKQRVQLNEVELLSSVVSLKDQY